MAITIVSSDDLCLSFSGDTEEPKTVFVVKPLTQFEYMKVAGVYQQCLGDMIEDKEEDDKKNLNKIVEIFASEKGEALKNVLVDFFKNNIKEVRNIKNKDGNLKTLSADKMNIDMFRPMEIFDILSQSIAGVSPDEEEIKN